MVPVGRLVLLRTVEKSDLVRAMSYVSVPALIGPVMGPPLGGFIVTYWSWRWIFFINIPIGILGIVLVNLLIGDLNEGGRAAVRLWRFCADRRGARDPGLRLRECRARRIAEHSRGGVADGRRRLHSALCAPCSARRPSDHRFGAVSDPHLCRRVDRRFLVPHGSGRTAVSAAADAAGRVRARRAVLRPVDLCQRRRRDDDEDDRSADHPRPGLSHRADRRCGDQRALSVQLQPVPADHPASGDLSGTAWPAVSSARCR